MKVAGLFLWKASVAGVSYNFWITTKKNDMASAASKTRTVINRKSKWRGAAIEKITYEGFLDA